MTCVVSYLQQRVPQCGEDGFSAGERLALGKMASNNFGNLFKELRLRLGLTLRDFCLQNKFDPGNISKLERGIFPPPQNDEKLEEYAKALKLREGSEEWIEFFDRAAADTGRLPTDIHDDASIMHRLPAFFRTIRDKKLSAEQLDLLIKRIKDS